ncbi:dicarboxylate/amino acid:cation symporter [Halomonas denitrificans]|uniref:dicarboxylate/amino acid:cation symporter n=1 Tax=Halomonas denitrificans TaxID=370769 RepID=UPI001C99D4A3|nr:dicarboxylate/amino acid:cation symporter [Halomonas denitrificans]MBY5969407.1 dicarboxylate/amino acid:cation symporter [Halomonas denitrificans]
MAHTRQILLALILGILAGGGINLFIPELAAALDTQLLTPLGQIFLRLLQFIVVPLVFCALVLSFTQVDRSENVGRYAGKLLLLYVVTSAVALAIGMGVAAWLTPGLGVDGAGSASIEARDPTPLAQWLVGLVPKNPFEALAQANLLQIILAAAMVGIAARQLPEQSRPLIDVLQSGYDITLKILSMVLRLAPIGVFALIASVVATQGFDLLLKLGLYVIGLLAAIAAMAVFYLALLAVAGARPLAYLRHFGEALSFALGTASSNATLPIALNNARDYGAPSQLSAFALPFGTALKRDGAAVLQGFNALFVAQLFGVDITLTLAATIFATGLLVSFSTAGVPGAGLVAMSTVLSAAGLPLEGVAVVAGVDRFTDGFRTALNVMGNTANAMLLARLERRPGDEVPASSAPRSPSS